MSRSCVLICLVNICCFTLLASSSAEEQPLVKAEVEAKITPEILQKYEHLFAPVPAEEINQSIKRGLDFLIAEQNENGSFGSATNTKALNIYAPIPGAHHGFRAATTALCIMALIKFEREFPETTPAINKAEDWLFYELPRVKRAEPDAIYNVWAHIYALQALAAMHDRHQGETAQLQRIEELIKLEYKMLETYESVDGGWGYYDFRYLTAKPSSDSISFVNAAGLVAFADVKQIGLDPPTKVKDRAIAATLRQRNADFSYLYGEYLKNQPVRPINRAGGSLGRSQACNVALRMWGDDKVTNEVMGEWINRLVLRNGWLDIGRKRPIPHESWFQVAGYFYYFGHYYAARSLHYFPADERPHYQHGISRLILSKQEKNGSWWDYPLYDYHPSYGTAYALLTLLECRVK